MGPLVMTSSTSSLRTGRCSFSLSDITRMVIFNRSVKLPEGAQFLCKYDEIFRGFYVKTLATQVQYPEIAIKYSSWLMNGYFPPIWKNHRYWLATIRRKMAKTFASCCVSIQSPNLHIKATFWICSSLRNSQHIQPSSTEFNRLPQRFHQVGPGRKRPGRGVQSAPQPPPFWWHARAQSTPGYGETLKGGLGGWRQGVS